jgi:hypothetical protein
MTDPLLLTPRECAARRRCSTRKLDRDRAEGRGCAYVRIDGRIFYRLEDVDRFIAAHLRGGRDFNADPAAPAAAASTASTASKRSLSKYQALSSGSPTTKQRTASACSGTINDQASRRSGKCSKVGGAP